MNGTKIFSSAGKDGNDDDELNLNFEFPTNSLDIHCDFMESFVLKLGRKGSNSCYVVSNIGINGLVSKC